MFLEVLTAERHPLEAVEGELGQLRGLDYTYRNLHYHPQAFE
jgi:hypothetical protein